MMIHSKSEKARQLLDSYHNEQVPAYAKADASRALRFVPSLYARVPAMIQTWLLLLIIVAAYGALMGKPAVPESTAQVRSHGRVHKASTPALSAPTNIPPWCFFAAAGGLVLLRLGWVLLATKSRSITIEPARLTFRRGVLNREIRSLEMTRIKNVSSYQPWWQRPFGIGTVVIESTDWGNRVFLMEGMYGPHDLRERILRAGVASRQYYGTTETWVSAF